MGTRRCSTIEAAFFYSISSCQSLNV